MVLKSFGVGLFSMIPVFGYKYIYQHFLPALSEYRIFSPLFDSALLTGIAVFFANLAILSVLLFILSGLITLILNFFEHNVLLNIKNALKQEPMGFTAVSLLLGFAVYLQIIAQEHWGMSLVGSVLGAIVILAIIEEYIKHLMVRITDDKKLNSIDDTITLSIIVGLAFAFVETLIYSFATRDMSIIFYRSMISIPVHIVASGIFGYYYGLAHFAKPMIKAEGGEHTYHLAGTNRKSLICRLLTFKRSAVYSEEKIIEGFFFAAVFHTAVNILFEFSLLYIAIPMISGGIFLLFYLYKKSHSLSVIPAKSMPI